jgi:hypothetical protein
VVLGSFIAVKAVTYVLMRMLVSGYWFLTLPQSPQLGGNGLKGGHFTGICRVWKRESHGSRCQDLVKANVSQPGRIGIQRTIPVSAPPRQDAVQLARYIAGWWTGLGEAVHGA